MMQLSLEQISPLTFGAVYLSGLVTSLTPCVYPIIPVVVGFLGARRGSARQRLFAAASYVLGLSLVYTALGLTAALTGSIFGSLTANPYVYLGFGVLILALGGNMMDWYRLPLPALSGAGERDTSSLFGPFLVGMSSGLVASPCTAPVLGTLLVYVAAKKAFVSGGLLLFTFSLGMSTILLVLGFSAGMVHRLPRSGAWMITIKKVLALVLLGAGIYFIFSAGKLM